MLPLVPSEAATIHAMQGATVGPDHGVKRLVVCLGPKRQEARAPGVAYVGVSRPTTHLALAFSGHVSLERLDCIGNGPAAQRVKAECARVGVLASAMEAELGWLASNTAYEEMLGWVTNRAMGLGLVVPF